MNFVRRNRPIFVIGVITALVFAVVILIGQNTKEGPSLQNSPGSFEVNERDVETTVTTGNFDESSVSAQIPPKPETVKPPKAVLPPIQMKFTTNGFEPITVLGDAGQTLRWINETDQPITIVELIKKNKSFPENLVIEPLATYEIILEGNGFWTFKEVNSGKTGRALLTE